MVWTRFLSLLVPLLAALLLMACGGDDDEPDPTATSAPTGTPAPIATVPPTETPTVAPTATAAPTSTPPPAHTATPVGGSAGAEQAAVAALAAWLGPVGDPASITVESVEALTWSNACLDLTRAGQVCAQVLVEGYRIQLGLGNAIYELRTDADGDVVLWAPDVQILVLYAESSPNLFAFTTDDGGTVEAQPVPGTSFGVDPLGLEAGDPVGVGLADAPQREGFLLVWLDPMEP